MTKTRLTGKDDKVAVSPTWPSIDLAELGRCLFDESEDALLVFDPSNLQIVDVNHRAQTLTRLSRPELLQTKLPALFAATLPRVREHFLEACQQTQSFHSREACRLAREGDDTLEVHLKVSRLQTKPTLLGLVAVQEIGERRAVDANLREGITERRLFEEALQKSETRFRSLVEVAPVCIHEIDLKGRLESINPAGLKMINVESESGVVGQDYLSFVDESDRGRVSSLMERAFNGEPSAFEFTTFVDGSRRLFSSNMIPIKNQDGEVQKLMGTTEDITERRAANEVLRASEEKFRALAEKSAAIVIMAQADQIVYCNAMLSVVSGYSMDEIARLRFLDLIHPDDREMVAQRYQLRLQGGPAPQRYEFKIATKNGEVRWVDFSGQLIDFNGGPAVLATWLDVTERKTAEERLRQNELQLAHVSRLSTMGEMVAGIAHEINQPLAAIANFAAAAKNSLAEMNCDDDSLIANWLQQVNEEAIRCGDIIRRLRSFVTKNGNDRESADLNQVVRDSVALMEATLRRQSVVIDCQMPAASPLVMVNQVQLQQVLLNLLRNACDAAQESPTPRINLEVDLHGDQACVAVEDNGRGIEESQREKLFDAFFTTKPDGMGMGLPISKSIVEAHGGSLRCDAGHAGGARFHIELPVAETAKQKDANL